MRSGSMLARSATRTRARSLAIAFGLLASGLIAWPAAAQTGVSLQAGAFQPWTGDVGNEFAGSVLTRVGRERSFRLGGEFMYREFETEFFGVDDIELESWRLAFVFHYVILPRAFIQPYLGAKFNVAVNLVDGDAIEAARPELDVIDVGTGVGIAGVVGFDVPIGDHFAIYGEGTFSADLQLTDEGGDLDTENIGGVSGVGGIRILF